MKQQIMIELQVVRGDEGKPVGVFLKIKDFKRLLDQLEDFYDVTKAERIIESSTKMYSMEEVERRITGKGGYNF